MICIKCKTDKPLTEFQFRQTRGKHVTTCRQCVNLKQRIKRNGGLPLTEFIQRKSTRKSGEKLTSHAIKLHRITRCEYLLCNCPIEEGQQVYEKRTYNSDHKYTIRTYCSEWCKEVAEIDKKLGLNTYETQLINN